MTFRDLAFIWLTKGQKPRGDVFLKEKNWTGKVLDELNYQFIRRLEKEGLISLKKLYIGGTEIEANTDKYTFVWRGSLNYHLAGLLDTIDAFYTKYNTFLLENGYGLRYNLGSARMFVIEGMDKVLVRNDPFSDSPLFCISSNLRKSLDIRQVRQYYENHKRGNVSRNMNNRR